MLNGSTGILLFGLVIGMLTIAPLSHEGATCPQLADPDVEAPNPIPILWDNVSILGPAYRGSSVTLLNNLTNLGNDPIKVYQMVVYTETGDQIPASTCPFIMNTLRYTEGKTTIRVTLDIPLLSPGGNYNVTILIRYQCWTRDSLNRGWLEPVSSPLIVKYSIPATTRDAELESLTVPVLILGIPIAIGTILALNVLGKKRRKRQLDAELEKSGTT